MLLASLLPIQTSNPPSCFEWTELRPNPWLRPRPLCYNGDDSIAPNQHNIKPSSSFGSLESSIGFTFHFESY